MIEFPPNPDPLTVPVPDSHTHLDLTLADRGVGGPENVAEAIERAASVGIDRIVQIGTDVSSSRWGVAVANEHPAVLAAVALHPNEAPRLANLDEALRDIERLAADSRVRAIGETGLDYFRTEDSGLAVQQESFRAHIDIAKRYGKALVVHDRNAHEDVLKVLDSQGAPDIVVLHCFSGDADLAMECVRRGYILSFAGNMTFKNAGNLREAAEVTPLGQLMVETDAPFLTPVPHRGKPNACYLVPLTVRALADVRGIPLDDVCVSISETAERVFGSWSATA